MLWLVKDALSEGTDVHARDDYALRWASGNGHVEVVKVLLNAGANVHANNDWALRCASEIGHVEVVKVVLAADAHLHASNDYALRWASVNGHLEVVKVLLDAGADVHAYDDEALQYASEYGHTEVVKLLKQFSKKKKKKIVNESIKNLPGRTSKELRSYFKGLDIFEKFEEACKHGILWAIKEVIEDYPNMYRLAPETYCHGYANAAYYNHINIVKYLAKKPILDDFYRDYAIAAAAAFGYLDLLKYFIEELEYDPILTVNNRVTFTSGRIHYSPLYTTACDGQVETIKYLISFKSIRDAISEYEAELISQKTGINI